MNGIDDVTELWQKLDHVRFQRKSLELSRRNSRDRGEDGEWKARALIAEARLQDLEKLLDKERESRARLENDLTLSKTEFLKKKQEYEAEAATTVGRLTEADLQLRAEIRRMRSQMETVKANCNAYMINLERERELRFQLEKENATLGEQLESLREERKRVAAEIHAARGKIAAYEKEIIPRLHEEQNRLESQIDLLRADLEDTIASETAFRTLFLQEQSNRRTRRSQIRDELSGG